jgi:hypothetical protein
VTRRESWHRPIARRLSPEPPMRNLLRTLMCCAIAVPALAQAPPPATPAAEPHPPVRAVRTERPISVDGVLNEDIWKHDQAITSFTQRDPDQGLPPRQRTEVRVAYDEDAIYVGARLHDTAPDSVVARLARRDNDPGSDHFTVMFDPYRDKRTGYFFMVSAAGVLVDGVMMNDGWDDWSWDGVWMARAQRDAEGWSCEMRIPFSQMRFNAGDQMVWGVNFQRSISRYSELDALVYTPRGQSGYVSRFPELQGLAGLKPGQHVEVTPYVTNKTEHLRFDGGSLSMYDADDPFHGDWKAKPAGGADLRMSLGSQLTLNATVNPDFGQVEIDPAVVNLSDVESFFDEKRPFFTEGTSVFRCGNNGANDYWGFNWPEPVFFYSRRIGRAPQGGTPSAEYTDRPVATHILGAAKITGQLAPGWNVGTVQALTNREEATLRTGPNETRHGVEPMSYYGVYRFMHEMNDRRQGLGVMTMTTARFFDGAADPLRDEVNDRSVVAAVDGWTFLDKNRTWVVSGYATGSHVHGSTARMASLQTGFPHYYQRPDRPGLGFDPDRTSLTGWGTRWWLNKQQGRLLLNTAVGALSPGFSNNDLGFQFGGDVVNTHFGIGWQWEKPSRWRQYANVLTALANTWDFGGNSTLKGLYVGGRIEGRNRYSYEANTFLFGPAFSPRKTRGGPLMTSKPGGNLNLYFDTNGRKPWFWWASYNPSWNEDGSWTHSVRNGVTWRPMPNLSLSGGPEYFRNHTDSQFWDNAGTLATGSRFTELEQTQLSMNMRADYAVTPNVSVQLYLQPLVSTLRFHELKELARSRSYEFVPVASGTQSGGTFGSMRGNAVVRWEYAPGSSAYFVWTQERADEDGRDTFDFDQSFRVLSSAPANNVFLVKVAHHFHL